MKKEIKLSNVLMNETRISQIILKGLKRKKIMDVKFDRRQDHTYSCIINNVCLGFIPRPNLNYLRRLIDKKREISRELDIDCKTYEIIFF